MHLCVGMYVGVPVWGRPEVGIRRTFLNCSPFLLLRQCLCFLDAAITVVAAFARPVRPLSRHC